MRRVLFFVVVGVACGGDSGSQPDARNIDFDRRGMLQNVGENVLLETYAQFEAEASSLATAVGVYCAALGTGNESTERTAAQISWGQAMFGWQRAEVMQLGPVTIDEGAYRDAIYSWPVVSSCAVDQDVMALRGDPGSYDIVTKLTNRRGLDALEYLLFNDDLGTSCAIQSAPAGWDPLSDAEKRAARCAFADVVAADVATQAAAVVTAWAPSGDDYLGAFVSTANPDDSLNALFGALFYLDTKTKDLKLAKPIGLATNVCGTQNAACVDALESTWAHVSKDNITANIEAFELVFTGGTGLGFDDFLRAAGADLLADTFEANLAMAGATAAAIPGTMATAVESDYAAVTDTYDDVKVVTDSLKSDVPGVLGLQVPDEAGGDAD